MSETALEQLQAITGLAQAEAQALLEAAGSDVQMAISLHFEQEEHRGQNAEAQDQDLHDIAAAPDDGMDLADALREDDNDHGNTLSSEETDPNPQNLSGAPTHHVATTSSYFGWAWQVVSGLSIVSFLFRGASRIFELSGIASLLQWVVLAPLDALGLLPPRGPTGAAAVQQFSSAFEAEYGQTHPRFFEGTLYQALQRSRQHAKFVLVYVRNGRMPSDAVVSRQVISSELVAAFVDEHFVFWVADVATPEGHALRQQLRLAELPAFAVLADGSLMGLARGGVSRAAAELLGSVHGPAALSEETVVARLQELLNRFEPVPSAPTLPHAFIKAPSSPLTRQELTTHLEIARAEQNGRDHDRRLREEQEAEYARALAEDQARELEEAAAAAREAEEQQRRLAEQAEEARLAEEAAAAAERRVRDRIAKASMLPDEPAVAAEATQVVVRMPDGTRLSRRFLKTCCLQVVVDWIEGCQPECEDFDLVSNYPRREFARAQRTSTLEALGLHPAATLFTKEA